jgi:hypothetical protein
MDWVRVALPLAAAAMLAGCQAPMWSKPGATTENFNTDRYQCMQGSQAQASSAYVNRYGGVASSGPVTNDPLYAACMNAKGWTLQRQSSDQQAQNKEGEAAAVSLKAKGEAICAVPAYAPYFSKTACSADKITFDQLADTSKISPAAKAIFTEVRNAIDGVAREYTDLYRKYGGAAGAKRADHFMATAKVQNDQNNLALYNGQITWGEYNRRRQQIYVDYTAAARSVI